EERGIRMVAADVACFSDIIGGFSLQPQHKLLEFFIQVIMPLMLAKHEDRRKMILKDSAFDAWTARLVVWHEASRSPPISGRSLFASDRARYTTVAEARNTSQVSTAVFVRNV